MVRVPIWEPNLSDLPGASKVPHSTGDSFGEQVGVAQQQAGAAIQKGFNELGSALTAQQDEQDAIKAKVVASDHETAVNLFKTNALATTPASEAATIPDKVQEFANSDWAQRRGQIGGKYQSIADANAKIFWNNSYVQNQGQAVKQYTDAVTTQVDAEVKRQGMNVFADPNNIHAATGAIAAYVGETTLRPDIQRQLLVDAAGQLQTQILAGYQLRMQNAIAQKNFPEASRLQTEMGVLATKLPGQLTEMLGINRLPKAVPPPVIAPGAPVRGPQRRSEGDTPGVPQVKTASLTTSDPDQGSNAGSKPFEIAQTLLGKHEVAHNNVISEFIGRVAGQRVNPAQTAWCAGFVNAVLRRSGLPGTDSLAARSFLNYGTATNDPQIGDIVVFSRGPGHGHVGFYAGRSEGGGIKVLGGNQGDRVSIATYSTGRVIGYRRVTMPKAPATRTAQAEDDNAA